MEKLLPPPSGSPEEIQAWNNMMDTMVTFIKASTHLMNTITKKVDKPSATPGGGRPNMTDIMGGCEPECLACKPRPPCGICGKEKRSPSRGGSATLHAKAAPAPQPTIAESTPIPEATADESITQDAPPADETSAQDSPAAEDTPATEETPGTEESSPPPVSAVEETSPPQSEESPVSEAPQAAGDKECICANIRAQRLAEEKKDRCSCKKKKKGEEDEDEPTEPPQPEVEVLCGCGATPGNRQAMVQDMVEKLANAQQEITKLQEELAKLQRMDASKRIGPHGGPNPAALYKEIMKDNTGRPYAQRAVGPARGRPFTSTPNEYPPGASMPYDGRSLPGGYIAGIDSPMGRPGMRTPVMSGGPGGRGYYPGIPPCRRPGGAPRPQDQPPADLMYNRSLPQDYETQNTPNPEYWSRLGEYGSYETPDQREMIVCPSIRSPVPESPPKRIMVCGPPRAPPSGSCDPNCRP